MQELHNRFLNAKRRLFDKVFSRGLNPEQCRAVFTAKGPLLVLAGAGSGKTTVLVNRISYLIKYGNAYFSDVIPDGVSEGMVSALEAAYDMPTEEIEPILLGFISEPCPPWTVLAFTFTNKAAKEIKDRLDRTFDDKAVSDSIWAGTFHSVCVRILRRYGTRVGYRDAFSIYDTDDKKRMISLVMKELGIDEKKLSPKAVANAISMAKDELVGPDDFEITRDPRTKDISAIYKLYQKKMMEYNAVDFDDIIMKTVELLEGDEEVREYYQNKFKYVLVDEYQDTNRAQFVLTKLLSDKYRNIMVVGDDDQSIYRFRGATVENILGFDVTYPDATVVKLEQNYRSTNTILSAANSIIGNNSKRHDKKLWCDKGEGEPITLKEAQDQGEEGKYIINTVIGGIKKEGRKYSDYAVLYRVNALGRALQTAFAKSGIPYRVVGDMGFYDRKEIRDMVAYLSVVGSSEDNLRLKRIINEPKRKIGAATVDALEAIASQLGMSMLSVMERVDEYPVLSKSADKLRDFAKMIIDIRNSYKLPSEYVKALFERTGYRAMLKAEGFEGEGKIENVEELISAAVEYENRCSDNGTEPELLGFLEEISLINDVDKYDENADAVVLMTVHAAKGLEFPVVFLAGMEDGIFPSSQSLGIEEEMSEERRLAYVAITRAKEKLYISYAKSRTMYGKTTYNLLSCFIRDELPRSLVVRDAPAAVPPRATFGSHQQYYSRERRAEPLYSEFKRAPEISTGAKKRGAESFGVERFSNGTRVSHDMFGEGTVVSSRDMGGDVLYEVRFDSGQVKKLMATFAKLKRL